MSTTTTPFVTILTDTDPGWDEARRAFNLAVDQRPSAIAVPETADGVQAVMAYADQHGLRVAAQSTGHNAIPLGPLSDTLLLKTTALREVTIDARARTARVGAGVLWQEVVDAAAPHGLTALAGSSPNVGVTGYTLGGGVSWLSRKYGLAANNVVSFDVVTADGRLRHVDASHDSDLFWALRGGGGSFGVVTTTELRLFPVAQVTAGLLWWPVASAPDVLATWRDLTAVGPLPDELTLTLRLLRLPDTPEVPEAVRGGAFVVVDVIFLGAEANARRLLQPLLDLNPVADTVGVIPARELGRLHLDPEEPLPLVGDGVLLNELTPTGVDEILRVAGPEAERPLPIVELRHLGGALRRPLPEHGALAAVDAGYVLFAGGALAAPDSEADIRDRIEALQTAVAPWAARQMYLNLAESPRDPATFWRFTAYERLRRIKAEVDPHDRIRANHPVPPAVVENAS